MGTHTVSSTSAAMRFLVLVFCFITLTVVASADSNPDNDHDSDSLALQRAEETPQLTESEQSPLAEAADEEGSSRAKAASKMLMGRCIRKKQRCRTDRGWCYRGGRSLCGKGRVCCYYLCGGKK